MRVKTVGIIAEYNPFHAGHAYHIRKIREEFGRDTQIVAVMSGNFPQRGGIAIADKYTRAAAAVAGGVDLVLELPFPFSGETAPVFASAGIAILHALGAVDVLSFGSECGDCSLLSEAAALTSANDFREAAHEASRHACLGYPAVYEALCRESFGDRVANVLVSPNNLLGIEYIRAAKAIGAAFAFHTVQRIGAPHDSASQNVLPSAYAIRTEIGNGRIEVALSHLPQEVADVYRSAAADGLFPAFDEKLSPIVLSHFCLNAPHNDIDIADAGGGLYNRLRNASFDTDTISSLIACAMTKKFTNSRIRRSLYYSFFGVTSSSVKELPEYTQVLALNENGRMLLKSIKKNCGISILTKPSATSRLSKAAIRQKELADKADSVFQLTLPGHRSGVYDVLSKPFVKHS